MNRTPLYEEHIKAGGRMIEFGGWELPVQYSGIIEEHKNTRCFSSLFDVSHMGEILVSGLGAKSLVQRLVTNDISRAKPGKAVYSPMCYENGGTVDDLLVYPLENGDYFLVVNAANKDKDYRWISEHADSSAKVSDVSKEYAQIAIQGPGSADILQKLTGFSLDTLGFYCFTEKAKAAGTPVLLSRTGYTGEDGFEIYISPDKAANLWEKLLEAGWNNGLRPAGLGARDTLRFEASMPLYGHELSESISPLEAGLDRFVKLDKEDFIGRASLLEQKAAGLDKRLAGLEMLERGIPRNGYEVQMNGKSIGTVTSGGFAPTLEKNLAMALLKAEYLTLGSEVDVIIRNMPAKAKVVDLPFYKRSFK